MDIAVKRKNICTSAYNELNRRFSRVGQECPTYFPFQRTSMHGRIPDRERHLKRESQSN